MAGHATTVLVTGSTDGLGRQVALDLAATGATVLIHGRSREKLDATRDEIVAKTKTAEVRTYLADLSSLAQVRALASEVLANEVRLDALVNNAGVIAGERTLSEDGYELTLAVSHLSHFLLTGLLLPLLRRSAPARVVNVSSAAQQPIDFTDPMFERGYDGRSAYGKAKLAQVMFTFDLAERLDGTGVTVTALHPATLMPTKMVAQSFGRTVDTIQKGADAVVRLAVSPEVEGVTGRYFNSSQEARASATAYDADARLRLWSLSEELCGGFEAGDGASAGGPGRS